MSTIEGIIPTLFGGVSRQPAQVRQPNQVEVMTNALPSVVSGGFEKRPATIHKADLTFLDATADWKTHGIDRSATEHDFLFIRGGTSPEILACNADTGAQKTVTVGDSIREFLIDISGINNTNIVEVGGADLEKQLAFDSGETTFDWTYELTDASSVFKVEGSADGAVWNDIATGKTGASGSFSTTIDAVATGDHNYVRFTMTTGASTADDTINVRAVFQDLTYLLGAYPEDIWVTSVADYTFLTNRNVTTRVGPKSTGTIAGTNQKFSDLPAASGGGTIRKVRGSDTDGFGSFYVKDVAGPVWEETVDPTIANGFDETSMPHQVVRSADGSTYTYSAATWDDRAAGDDTLNPAPGFIGGVVNDIIFYRNRLGFLSDETCYLSQARDVFNLYAEKATEVLDSDPVERGATTEQVNILQFGKVFRKLLFLTSANAQFELESGAGRALTQETADLNQATTYRASRLAKPAALGDVMYFASDIENSAVIYEYYFQDSSFSNTATDITRHVRTYIPTDISLMYGDAAAQTLFVLSTGEHNALYVYNTFFDDSEKLQSAWCKYTFGATEAAAFIHGFHVFSGRVHLIIEREDGNIYLEVLPIDREEIATGMPWMPLLDQRALLTGSYDSGTNLTTITTTWDNEGDAEVVCGPDCAIPGQLLPAQTYPSATTLTVTGDYSSNAVYVGRPYTMTVELSKIYPRQQNSPILTGRLQLQDMTVLFAKTGYYKLQVTSSGSRDVKAYEFEGKILGGGLSVDDATLEDTGSARHKLHGRGDLTKLEFINDKPLPCVITSVQWRGLFNETGRAG
jgi:hypothetical protein